MCGARFHSSTRTGDARLGHSIMYRYTVHVRGVGHTMNMKFRRFYAANQH